MAFQECVQAQEHAGVCGCVVTNIESDKWKALAGELADAVKATDIYFKALAEQWAANDGRVVSESGVVLEGSKDAERLCEIAGNKVGPAAIKARALFEDSKQREAGL